MRHPARLLAVASRSPAVPDADLLAAWAAGRDADAFAELVRRYGPLVWRTCRGVAGDTPAAEDAFQAAFLALARRAGHVTAVAGFLNCTAGRAALKAARRDRRRPPPTPGAAAADPLDQLLARELLAAVDAEIARLPEGQRSAVLLCGVAGLSTDEAARLLGWTAEAVRGRLQRDRATVRARLAAKGLTVPAVIGLGLVPDRLTATALAIARGGPLPAGVARLAQGGLTMWAWLRLTGLVLMLGGLAVAGGSAVDPPPATAPAAVPAADPPPAAPAAAPVSLWEGDKRGEAGTGLWHPDGRHVLAIGSFDRKAGPPHEVRAWDTSTGRLVKSFPMPPSFLGMESWGSSILAVSADGRTVAAGLWRGKKSTDDHAVAVWAWDRPADPPTLLPLTDYAAGVCFDRNPASGLVYAATKSGRLSAFRVGGDPKPVAETDLPTPPPPFGGRASVQGLTSHPTARVLAVAHGGNEISFWCPGSPRLDSVYPGGRIQTHPVAIRPDGRRLTLFGESKLGDDRRLILVGYDLTVQDSASGERMAAGRVPPVSGDPLPRAGGRDWGLNHSAYSPDGRFLALGGKDETAWIADAVSGRVLAEWPEAGPVRAAHFSPDGRRLLTVAKGAVRVRDVADKLVPLPPDRDMRLTHERELDRFAGRWVVSDARIDGRDTPRMIGGGMSMHVVAVDPAVTPKAANVRHEAGPKTGDLARAIYEFLDADTYRICYSFDADRRPTAFTAEAGSRQSLFTFERAK